MGRFSAVSEPDVFVLLPKSYLVNGALTFQQGVPFDDSISATRDDPGTLLPSGNPSASVTKRWQSYWKNMFFGYIGEDGTATPLTAPWKSDRLPFTVDVNTDLFTLNQDWTLWQPNEDIRVGGANTSTNMGGWPKGAIAYASLTNTDGSPLPANQFYASSTHPIKIENRISASVGPTDTTITMTSVSGYPTTYPWYQTCRCLQGLDGPSFALCGMGQGDRGGRFHVDRRAPPVRFDGSVAPIGERHRLPGVLGHRDS